MCQGTGPSATTPEHTDTQFPDPSLSAPGGWGVLPPSQPPLPGAPRRPRVALGPSQAPTLTGFVTLGKSLPPLSLRYLLRRAEPRGRSCPAHPGESGCPPSGRRFVNRSARQRRRAPGGSVPDKADPDNASSFLQRPGEPNHPAPQVPENPHPAGRTHAPPRLARSWILRTCSRRSAAGAASLGARPERPVARRAEAVGGGGGGLGPGRRRRLRGARAARGPELGGARPGRRRLRLEVRGGG